MCPDGKDGTIPARPYSWKESGAEDGARPEKSHKEGDKNFLPPSLLGHRVSAKGSPS